MNSIEKKQVTQLKNSNPRQTQNKLKQSSTKKNSRTNSLFFQFC